MNEGTSALKLNNDYGILSEDDYKYSQALDAEYINEDEEDFKKFTEQDYANLQHNLVLFKDGNREATEYIIAAFHRTLHKYTHFIVFNKIQHYKGSDKKTGELKNCIDKSLLSFISLFKCKNHTFPQTLDYIHKLFAQYEYGDIYNELVLALLNMANKYKIITDPNDPKYKPNGTFHIYVRKCFHFEAFYFLKQLVKDPITDFNLSSLTISDNDEYSQVMNKSKLLEDQKIIDEYNLMIDYVDREISLKTTDRLILKEDNIDLYDDNSLNFNWIQGIVCDPVFDILTDYERELLVLSYIKNQTDDVLSILFGYSRAAIGSHRRKAIKKLKEEMIRKGVRL